jgi:hypothetical protein
MKLRPIPLRWSLAAIALLGVVLVRLVLAQPTNALQIMLPALPGDGALVITPQGHTLLIDGSADGAAAATWLGHNVPFGQRRIDAAVLTRATDETLPGQLAAIKRYEIGAAFIASGAQGSDEMTAWRQLLGERSTPIHILQFGSRVPMGECALDVLTASDGHATLALDCAGARAYFLQSIDDETQAVLATMALPPATLAFYPWARPTRNDLLEHLQPQMIVFSEGGTDETQESFAQRRVGTAQLLHEAVHGDITLVIDEGRVQVHTQKDRDDRR